MRVLFFAAAVAASLSSGCQLWDGRTEALGARVASASTGWALAVEAFGHRMGDDVRPVSVLVDITVDEGEVVVEAIHYFAAASSDADRHWWVTLDNLTLTAALAEQDSPVKGPFPGRWIDMERLALDVRDALDLGERYLGDGPLSDLASSPDPLIDLVLSPGEMRSTGGTPEHDLVWALSYDGWTAAGPQGFLRIEIDAETGDIVEVVDHR